MSNEASCAVPFFSGCPVEEVYVVPCEPEPSLEHVGLRCTQCGRTASATREKQAVKLDSWPENLR